MNEKNIKPTDVEKVSGGVHQAINGAYWLTDQEVRVLRAVGYRVSTSDYCNPLPGWHGVEAGTFIDDETLCQVNDPQNQRVRNVEELADVINRNNDISNRPQ